MKRRDALRLLALAAGMPHVGGIAQGAKTIDTASMNAKKIPSSGEMLPVIGLGTWQTFDVGADAATRAPLQAVLREFVALGG